MLNLISLVGLFSMVALAWLMSSHRDRINWRLVVFGLGLQLILAAVFFNSQSWTFSRKFDQVSTLEAAVESKKFSATQVDSALAKIASGETEEKGLLVGNTRYTSFEAMSGDLKSETISRRDVDAAIESNGGLRVPRFVNGITFYCFDSFFGYIKKWADAGAVFVFRTDPGRTNGYTHPMTIVMTFAFGVLPTVIFFAALMSVLYHIGLMQKLVSGMAWVMQKTLGTSGAESLAAAANVFVGHTEAPLVVKPYIATMTRSELNALMVGGFATITGGLMAVFVGLGISAGHLVIASLVSAPAALVIAKILQPETEESSTKGSISVQFEKTATNVIEAAANGASEGMKLAINIAAMLIAFLALIAMLDTLLLGVGNLFEWIYNSFASKPVDLNWSLKGLFAIIFWPFAFVMGIEANDCKLAGELLGTKMVVNEFIAYMDMGTIVSGGREGASLSPRSQVILTYALCGFSNFGAIAIQLGGIGPLAPNRRSDLAQLGLRAMVGGTLACCMTACIAGVFYGILG